MKILSVTAICISGLASILSGMTFYNIHTANQIKPEIQQQSMCEHHTEVQAFRSDARKHTFTIAYTCTMKMTPKQIREVVNSFVATIPGHNHSDEAILQLVRFHLVHEHHLPITFMSMR